MKMKKDGLNVNESWKKVADIHKRCFPHDLQSTTLCTNVHSLF